MASLGLDYVLIGLAWVVISAVWAWRGCMNLRPSGQSSSKAAGSDRKKGEAALKWLKAPLVRRRGVDQLWQAAEPSVE